MKTLCVGCILAAAMLGLTAEAFAQTRKSSAPVYRYCLFSGGPGGLAGATLCRFNTLAQCLASRAAFGDTCIINPELTFRR
jgi:hypothetical protein